MSVVAGMSGAAQICRPVVDVEELAELLSSRSDVRLLDVRTPGEFESAHIPGAYNVPLESLAEHAAEIRSVSHPIFLICQTGRRAAQAEDPLRAAGMPNLHLLDGGMNAWVAAQKPIIEGRNRISLERQVRIAAGGLAAIGAILALLIDPWFAMIPAFIGTGLVFSGITDTCGMAMIMAKLPYNQSASCDTRAMVEALKSGAPPSQGEYPSITPTRGACSS